MLNEHKEVLGWTIADIKGISPSVVMHQIHLEENPKTSREPQRRLNPVLKEVVRAEVMKLLDAGIIYPISDSQWVRSVQVVPKSSKSQLLLLRIMSWFQLVFKLVGKCA